MYVWFLISIQQKAQLLFSTNFAHIHIIVWFMKTNVMNWFLLIKRERLLACEMAYLHVSSGLCCSLQHILIIVDEKYSCSSPITWDWFFSNWCGKATAKLFYYFSHSTCNHRCRRIARKKSYARVLANGSKLNSENAFSWYYSFNLLKKIQFWRLPCLQMWTHSIFVHDRNNTFPK